MLREGRDSPPVLTVGELPEDDAVILISPKRARDKRLIAALKPLIGAVPVEAMRKANYAVDRDQAKQSPAQAAANLAAALKLK